MYPRGAGDDRLDDAVLLGAGEHEDARGGREQRELLDQLDAGNPRKSQVHQHDVGAQVDDDLDGVVCVRRFADDLEPAARERLGEGGADQSLVVDEGDGSRCFALHGRILPDPSARSWASPVRPDPSRGFVRTPVRGSPGPLLAPAERSPTVTAVTPRPALTDHAAQPVGPRGHPARSPGAPDRAPPVAGDRRLDRADADRRRRRRAGSRRAGIQSLAVPGQPAYEAGQRTLRGVRRRRAAAERRRLPLDARRRHHAADRATRRWRAWRRRIRARSRARTSPPAASTYVSRDRHTAFEEVYPPGRAGVDERAAPSRDAGGGGARSAGRDHRRRDRSRPARRGEQPRRSERRLERPASRASIGGLGALVILLFVFGTLPAVLDAARRRASPRS